MQIVSNICLPLVVVLALQWHSSPSQALNNIGNHPDCGKQPGDPHTELDLIFESDRDDEFPEFGGRYTTPFKYPWMAKLNRKPNVLSCSATILNERWALTAAHCLRYGVNQSYRLRKTEDFLLYAGRFDLSQDESDTEQKRELERAIIHPRHNPRDYIFDLALLKLKAPLRFGAKHKVGAICLPTKPNINVEGLPLTVLGWGYRDYDDPKCPLSKRKLREVTSRAWRYQDCKQAFKRYRHWRQSRESNKYNYWFKPGSYSDSDSDSTEDNNSPWDISLDQRTKWTICWGQKDVASTCSGDSGGAWAAWDPKMAAVPVNKGRWVQYGVHSFGFSINDTDKFKWRSPNYVSFGMRVSKVTGWIWATVNEFSTESDGITIATVPVRTIDDPPVTEPTPKRCQPLIHVIRNVPNNVETTIRYFKKPHIKAGRSSRRRGEPNCVMP